MLQKYFTKNVDRKEDYLMDIFILNDDQNITLS